MKKIFVILGIIVIAFCANAQTSSKSLLRQRDKEIQAIEKVGYNPEIEAEKIAEVNNLYVPLIERSMEIESEKISQKKERNSQSEVQKGRAIIGANVEFEGDRGTFSANSISSLKGSQAYAVVTMADANAHLIRKVADNVGSETIKGSDKALLVNENSHNVTFIVKGLTVPTELSVVVSARSSQEIELFPGSYEVRTNIHLGNYTPSEPVIKEVGNPLVSASYGGKSYSFVLTFRKF